MALATSMDLAGNGGRACSRSTVVLCSLSLLAACWCRDETAAPTTAAAAAAVQTMRRNERASAWAAVTAARVL